ncbi:MAG TPA: M28 family peptidase [Nevskiaceae bacterium]|nr:M28 family peptidase [Nevskiaceae bacterium]
MRYHFVALFGAVLIGGAAASTASTIVPPSKLITADLLRGHVRFISSDLTEGRGTASRGDDIAMAYIQAQMESMGLQPGAPDGSWYQRFDVVGINSHIAPTVAFSHGGQSLVLNSGAEFIGVAGEQKSDLAISNAEVVFAGYGIQAPEYRWDDFKDVDVRGKILLVMNNDPEDDPSLFAGRTRLYYGRWMYKYEQAARMGAAGAIIIHTEHSAAYPWQVVQTSWSGENFELPQEHEPRTQLKGWATEDASRRIAALGGFDLDQLRAQAEKREFRPVPLGVTLSLAIHSQVKRQQTANVIGRLPGHDPQLAREALFYTAHHDHLGIKQGAAPGEDAIYNGALDNASGCATLLAIARAMASGPKLKRTVYFASVGAEEQGLLGSRYLAEHPPLPAGRIAADINMDGISIWGRTHDVTVIGLGKSTLDDDIRAVAAAQKRTVVGDPFPDKGSYYRSDQFSFAHIGVPGAYLGGGIEVLGRPAGWGAAQKEAFVKNDYHQPSDELRDSWDFSGAVEDAQLLYQLGARVADAPQLPAWTPGDEFEGARKRAIGQAQP